MDQAQANVAERCLDHASTVLCKHLELIHLCRYRSVIHTIHPHRIILQQQIDPCIACHVRPSGNLGRCLAHTTTPTSAIRRIDLEWSCRCCVIRSDVAMNSTHLRSAQRIDALRQLTQLAVAILRIHCCDVSILGNGSERTNQVLRQATSCYHRVASDRCRSCSRATTSLPTQAGMHLAHVAVYDHCAYICVAIPGTCDNSLMTAFTMSLTNHRHVCSPNVIDDTWPIGDHMRRLSSNKQRLRR